jgi:hypothetical protein
LHRDGTTSIEDHIKFGESDECWLWTGPVNGGGYGTAQVSTRRIIGVHVYMYEKHVGPIPPGCLLHHTCETKRCCNYHHLEPVSRKRHGELHRKTHCKNGHEFTPQNTRWTTSKEGKIRRSCRACHRMYRTGSPIASRYTPFTKGTEYSSEN